MVDETQLWPEHPWLVKLALERQSKCYLCSLAVDVYPVQIHTGKRNVFASIDTPDLCCETMHAYFPGSSLVFSSAMCNVLWHDGHQAVEHNAWPLTSLTLQPSKITTAPWTTGTAITAAKPATAFHRPTTPLLSPTPPFTSSLCNRDCSSKGVPVSPV